MNKYPKQGLKGVSPDNLNWLNGNWKGQQDQNQYEEYWSSVNGGTLMAMFRWIKNQEISFYEFILLEQAGEHVMMRIKHFYPQLQGWETQNETVDFLLVYLQDREAAFLQINKPDQWLVYRLESEDKLVSYFYTEDEPVKPEDVFDFIRQDNAR